MLKKEFRIYEAPLFDIFEYLHVFDNESRISSRGPMQHDLAYSTVVSEAKLKSDDRLTT